MIAVRMFIAARGPRGMPGPPGLPGAKGDRGGTILVLRRVAIELVMSRLDQCYVVYLYCRERNT